MLRIGENGVVYGKFIQFLHVGKTASGKTDIFLVQNPENGSFLGEVRWHGAWRKYCFFPTVGTLFEQVCLRDISDFIEAETQKQKVK